MFFTKSYKVFSCFALAHDGFLEKLFNATGAMKQNVFLQISNQNGTGCSNVQGYMIKISRNNENETPYKYDISKLNDTLAKTKCNQYTNTCLVVPSISTITGMF